MYDHKNITKLAVVHYHQFRHISQVCRLNYHGQSCRRPRINPAELKMIRCLLQRDKSVYTRCKVIKYQNVIAINILLI